MVFIDDPHADETTVICERCHKKQITNIGQNCVRCDHEMARFFLITHPNK